MTPIMLRDDSDASWEAWGREDPYFGVLSSEEFHAGHMDARAREAFFASGREHVATVLASAARYFAGPPAFGAALDFGCGVGRLVIPLARRFARVTGVDVAPSMLAEAARNCREAGVENVAFVRSDDDLEGLAGTFDLIHSVIVFQHIPVARGERLIARLLDHLAPGGIAALHVHLHRHASPARKAIHRLRARFRPLDAAIALAQGERWNRPLIQMNEYDLNRLVVMLHDRGFGEIHLQTREAGPNVSAFLFVRRPAA